MDSQTQRYRVAGEVRACIARAGLRPSKVAQATDIPQSTLSRRLSGETAFTVDELATISAFLDVDIREFFPVKAAA